MPSGTIRPPNADVDVACAAPSTVGRDAAIASASPPIPARPPSHGGDCAEDAPQCNKHVDEA